MWDSSERVCHATITPLANWRDAPSAFTAAASARERREIAAWLRKESQTIIIICAAVAALAIYKHKANIKRLLNGTENRIGGKKTPPPAAPAQTK